MKSNFTTLALIFVLSIFSYSGIYAQCMNIESILVDACEGDGDEGLNEMVRFKIGNAPLNTSQMNVNFPSNSWGGLIQNASTAQKVNLINQEILAAGGCGQILEPTNGVLPANATVILVTSHLFDVALNPFGAMNDTIYIVFQNSVATGGHFGNFGTSAMRTLTISFGSCSDTVSYNRSLLIDENGNNAAGNGATVEFDSNGAASYVNNGCSAPVSSFIFEISQYPTSSCANATFSLVGEATGYQSVTWSSDSGTFSSPNSLTTNFTVSNTTSSQITITFTMVNICGLEVSQSVQINLQAQVEPVFTNLPTQICNATDFPILPTTSSNGISGTWSPAAITDNYQGEYVFTPNAEQCAKTISRKINVSKLSLELIGSCEDSDFILKALTQSTEPINYVWKNEFGAVVASNQSTFNVSAYIKTLNDFSLPLIFTVEATVGTCVLSESITVNSIYCAIQKGISPNNDGLNDFFDLRSVSVLQLNVYNRYGTEVFKKQFYKDEWHGQNSKGDLLPVGTYFYSIRTVSDETLTGWVQLHY